MNPGPFLAQWAFNVVSLEQWLAQAQQVLTVLAGKPGFVSGEVLRYVDSGERLIMHTSWTDVGSYRRAVGSTEAKMQVWPFLADALDEPGAYEVLLELSPEKVSLYSTSVS